MSEYGPTFEAYMAAGRKDASGREIGYVVGLRDNGTEFAAWVQNARKANGIWVEFGASQRSKSFKSQAAATNWAYATAKERIAKVRAN
jgi:hypothetical protein